VRNRRDPTRSGWASFGHRPAWPYHPENQAPLEWRNISGRTEAVESVDIHPRVSG
jgi:hypothetical protein